MYITNIKISEVAIRRISLTCIRIEPPFYHTRVLEFKIPVTLQDAKDLAEKMNETFNDVRVEVLE